jgi:hypothetical protein
MLFFFLRHACRGGAWQTFSTTSPSLCPPFPRVALVKCKHLLTPRTLSRLYSAVLCRTLRYIAKFITLERPELGGIARLFTLELFDHAQLLRKRCFSPAFLHNKLVRVSRARALDM